MKALLHILVFLFFASLAWSQCDPYFLPPLSNRVANYEIQASLNHESKKIFAKQTLEWTNSSPDTVRALRMYMYMNAFKNTRSTFISRQNQHVFGEDISRREESEWGWIHVDSIGIHEGKEITSLLTYIQPDDQNPYDQTVLEVPLDTLLLPGERIKLNIKFTVKLPKIIARSGYSKDDFFLMVHWFPQVGVYERLSSGKWGWNCHQFFPGTEFYADFGTYKVDLTTDKKMVIGASGCKMKEQTNSDGTQTHTFYVEDVIDFAWTAYPHFKELNTQWKNVDIRLLIPQEHLALAPRYIASAKQSLEYLTAHVGEYPYPTLTIMDPPLHGLRSGMMEYPTFVTTGTASFLPRSIRTMESLLAHEFTHQYFMGMLASNEKEEAWVDEGFVTYFEDRIMMDKYGEKTSLFDIFGFRSGNRELTRLEYTGMSNPKVGTIARPGWEITESYKGLVYSKTATMLHSLEKMVGQESMDAIIQTYFERFKFKHPRGTDFIEVANEVVTQRHGNTFGPNLNWLFDPCLYETVVCDYEVVNISNDQLFAGQGLYDDNEGGIYFEEGIPESHYTSVIRVHRLGEFVIPVDVRFYFQDGTIKDTLWTGEERSKSFIFRESAPIVAAHIDPDQKVLLDLDLNNNSLTIQPDTSPLVKYTLKVVFWIQNVLQTVGFLI